MNNLKLYKEYDETKTQNLEKKLLSLDIEPDFTANAISVLKKRYFRKDEWGVPQEDVKGLFARVAANIAYPELYYTQDEKKFYEAGKKFYEMMINREFMPNSPTLMNAGREMQQLSACFVLPVEDEMESIFGQVYYTAMIHKSGGGTGFSFSNLRRKNDFVSTTYGKASGPVSFIIAYDSATHAVNQGGFRRGANMGILRVDHPDILEFIHAKENERDRRFENFNFSVGITDDFMRAIKKGGYYVLKNPRKGKLYNFTIEDIKRDEESVRQGLITDNERVLVAEGKDIIYQNPVEMDIRGRITKVERKKVGRVDEKGRITLDAKLVFDEIANLAWRNGEPGIIFLDEINRHNTTPKVGKIESTNPCGEQPLLPYEACNLGSINLGTMVKDGKINYEKLKKITKDSVDFLDNVIDMSNFHLPLPKYWYQQMATFIHNICAKNGINETIETVEEKIRSEFAGPIEEMVHSNRKIGLGVMGWADMLTQLKIPYNSEEAVNKAEEVMKFIQDTAEERSEELAEEKGAFLNFDKSIYAENGDKPRRNATCTTIAPTGSISIIAGASSGIEPLFGLVYTHTDADGVKREFRNQFLEKDLKEAGIDTDKIFSELIKGKSLQELDVPEKIKKIYITSKDIPVEYHVKMQAAFQKYTHNAVSKTANMPNSATVDDIKKVYQLSYELGCKGITVYRNGSRQVQVIKEKKEKSTKPSKEKGGGLEKMLNLGPSGRIIPHKKLPGTTYEMRTGCGKLFVTVNHDPETGKLLEVFQNMSPIGGCGNAQTSAQGILTSLYLQQGGDTKKIYNLLDGTTCPKQIGLGLTKISSCTDAMIQAMRMHEKRIAEGEILIENRKTEETKISKPKENPGTEKNEKKIPERKSNLYNIVDQRCEECGSALEFVEGCNGGKCPSCGWSSCG